MADLNRSAEEKSMRANLQAQADKMLRWLGTPTAETFLPGLSEAEINRDLQGYALNLSSELRELYQWRNGQMIESGGGFRLPFQIYAFLPLQIALERSQYLAGISEWRSSWFPVLSNEAGDYYYCDCDAFVDSSPVFHYFLHSEEDDRSIRAFPSVERLLIAIREDEEPNQSTQRNASSRPSSGDSSASETPSSLGPRG